MDDGRLEAKNFFPSMLKSVHLLVSRNSQSSQLAPNNHHSLYKFLCTKENRFRTKNSHSAFIFVWNWICSVQIQNLLAEKITPKTKYSLTLLIY